MAEIKTTQNDASVADFLQSVSSEQKRKDSLVILEMMEKASGEAPKMWGGSLIGFGYVRIKSPSGREVDWFLIGFSPRKANLSLYLNLNVNNQEEALARLGKHKTGLGCLYINKLADVNLEVLQEMIDTCLNRGPQTT